MGLPVFLTRRAVPALALLCGALGVSAGFAGTAQATTRNPVLVISGYAADQTKLSTAVSMLQGEGLTVYSMNLNQDYPLDPYGSAAITVSANSVGTEVAAIKSATGASHVDIVAHSEGGLAARYYIKYDSGLSQIGTYVDLGTPEYGDSAAQWCWLEQGCQDMLPNSPFLNKLNTSPPMPSGIPAFHFYSTNGTGELTALPGAWNASVQSFCPGRTVQHADELTDAAMWQLYSSALAGGPVTTTCP